MKSDSNNIFWQQSGTRYEDRCRNLCQKGLVVWFTGLSGAGKTTVAMEVEKELFHRNHAVYTLDGDNLRYGLNSDLGFSEADRMENVRRVAEVAVLFKDAGFIILVTLISPNREMRSLARQIVGENSFLEVYVKANLNTCMARDPKGLYQKALKGEILHFTGISDPYEEPESPEVLLETDHLTINDAAKIVLTAIERKQRET